MKNKKAVMEVSVGTIVTIVLIIVAIGILWMLTLNILEPQFKIYKEECEEIRESIAYTLLNEGLIDYEEVYNITFITNSGEEIDAFDITLIYYRCKQVEVDEIELYCSWIEEENCEVSGKLNLNLEWLDKNCEAINFTKCEDLECKNQKIYEYKCGDYFVEVEK